MCECEPIVNLYFFLTLFSLLSLSPRQLLCNKLYATRLFLLPYSAASRTITRNEEGEHTAHRSCADRSARQPIRQPYRPSLSLFISKTVVRSAGGHGNVRRLPLRQRLDGVIILGLVGRLSPDRSIGPSSPTWKLLGRSRRLGAFLRWLWC
jgi:hypothetical protein